MRLFYKVRTIIMNLNKVFIIGRVTSDLVLKATPSGQAVTNFSVATNRIWTDKAGAKQEEAEFHNVVVWGRQAELASQFLSKGSLVMVEGRLQTRTWKDAQSQTHRVTEIIVERLQFGPRSAGGGAPSGSARANTPIPAAPHKEEFGDSLEENIPEISLDEEDIKPEDLPF
ncbi:MAG: single-stranded DNA-binding protein [Candidatus Paceibacterota bacterium]